MKQSGKLPLASDMLIIVVMGLTSAVSFLTNVVGRGSSEQDLGREVFIIFATSSSEAAARVDNGKLESKSGFAYVRGVTGSGFSSIKLALIC